ncbi:response regulator transcription factor [Nonomuraea soli]
MAEDERFLADLVAEGLRRASMTVEVAYDGAEALRAVREGDFDVLVLDRDLPEVHGDEICRLLAAGSTRILMLTAAASVPERVAGLSLGADDYLPKPFAYAELVARVQALGRRGEAALPPVLTGQHGIVLDTPRRQAFRDGRYLNLSRKEFAVLEVLMRARGRVVSAEELLEQAWDDQTDPFTTVVRVTIRKLRTKLGEPQVIQTVSGAGYRV